MIKLSAGFRMLKTPVLQKAKAETIVPVPAFLFLPYR